MTVPSTTRLEISLDALTYNFKFLKSKIKSATKFLAVVKATAYGSGEIEIARHLESLGVDYFGVAFPQEGIFLRQNGITSPILVFHPFREFCSEIIEHNLEPAIYSFSLLDQFLESSKRSVSYPIHLKFNTGLNRLGFDKSDLTTILQKIITKKQIRVKSIYSHLATSEDKKEDYFTMTQIKAFNHIISSIKAEIPYPFMTHILNTSGILNFSELAQMDMVRSGIGLYGFGNDARYRNDLKPISTLKTTISQIRFLSAKESLGYNRAFYTQKPSRIAILPIGHADGINKIYGLSRGYVYINNQKAFIVGNVCMDMIMVDITNVNCKLSDEVIIFGEKHSAEILAEEVGTISYELITAISSRVQRIVV